MLSCGCAPTSLGVTFMMSYIAVGGKAGCEHAQTFRESLAGYFEYLVEHFDFRLTVLGRPDAVLAAEIGQNGRWLLRIPPLIVAIPAGKRAA